MYLEKSGWKKLSIRDSVRTNLLEFTKTAFKMLPPMENPSILDIGCGTGIQSIELAQLCNGHSNMKRLLFEQACTYIFPQAIHRCKILRCYHSPGQKIDVRL